MKSIKEALISRVANDSTIVSLIGSADRIIHGYITETAQIPCISYIFLSANPGQINSDSAKTQVHIVRFVIYSDSYEAIYYRLRRLLDGHIFSDQDDVGSIQIEWEGDGPDSFDQDLNIRYIESRYQIFSIPIAVGKIT